MKKTSVVLAMIMFCMLLSSTISFAADVIDCWFPPDWKYGRIEQAEAIARTLSKGIGITVRPKIAQYYPNILEAFTNNDRCMVYGGSFVSAIIRARNLGVPVAQGINGNEMYAGVMIYQKGLDPEAILRDFPTKVAYTTGASSGESCAMAATGGRADMRSKNFRVAANSVQSGLAKAAFVKDSWWKANASSYPELDVYWKAGISEKRHPDNLLTVSNSISLELREKIRKAATGAASVFQVREIVPFDPAKLDFSIDLMKKGGIDPLKYRWEVYTWTEE